MEGQGVTDSQTMGSTPSETSKSKHMEKNEIKKLLYRENPIAKLLYIRDNHAFYKTVHIDFEIPVDDLKGGDFELEMESKFLIRWLV